MVYTSFRITLSILWITLAYKLGDWKNWKNYYPTLLFYGMGDLIYNVVFYSNRLWVFETDVIVASINGLLVYFLIFVPNILIYLSRFPEKLMHQIGYIVLWISIYMAIEFFTTSIGMQTNYNGWNIWWSLLHNIIMFPLIIVHHKKHYILSWSGALCFLVVVMIIFDVPILIGK